MRRRLLLSLAFSAHRCEFFIQSAPEARPQGKGPEPTDELIETADGVKLRGIYYKGVNSMNGSCVMIIMSRSQTPPRATGTAWPGLGGQRIPHAPLRSARARQEQGPDPGQVLGGELQHHAARLESQAAKDTLDMKDFQNKRNYYPQMVYDLAAARNHLDKLNDDGQLNTSSIYLIGDGDAATLGMMFLATEWHGNRRSRWACSTSRSSGLPRRSRSRGQFAGGRDYGGAVWLSPKS